MIEVTNIVEVYELNGSKLNTIKSHKPKLTVKSHWNENRMVTLQLDDGSIVGVYADDLIASINNATNSARF